MTEGFAGRETTRMEPTSPWSILPVMGVDDHPEPDDVASLRHELRNAINAMITSSRCLERCTEIAEEHRRFVTAISTNGDRARDVLERLLGSIEQREHD